jgi:beta-glucosidase/6-phospho-beta-glucosidase/beta-galactosidase
MPMFRSFYLAGFECATGYNMHGEWIDQIAATEHDLHVAADYRRLGEVGIHAVREAIRWPLVDRGGRFDFSSVEPFVEAALEQRIDVIWDLFHYGYPDDVDLFSPAFVGRFARYCEAAARFVARRMGGACWFTPVNEPSYFAWAGGEVARFAPHLRGRGFELKVALARAAIRGIEAIHAACPGARIVNVDPICRVVPGRASKRAIEHARLFNEEWVFQFWDIVSGRLHPEYGGTPRHLDVVGLNYYWTNQWELGREGVPLGDDDPRRVPLADLVQAVWRRYDTEVLITETSALGDARAPWIHELSVMAEQLLADGVPLRGICLYPILGMPEWHSRDQWTRMGLWDLEREQDVLERKACAPMVDALRAVHASPYLPFGTRHRSPTPRHAPPLPRRRPWLAPRRR